MKKIGCLILLFINISLWAQYVKLHDFGSIPFDLESPQYTQLVTDGTSLFGMTSYGGNIGGGGIFKIQIDGTGYSKIFDFNSFKGFIPFGSLLISDSVLYGMTSEGGSHGFGVIFKISFDGTNYTKLFEFDGLNGSKPHGSLVMRDSILYGMTSTGGANGLGVVFGIKYNGTEFKKLLDFDGNNGSQPLGSLTFVDSVLFGMTQFGGNTNYGVLFKINPDGDNYTKLVDFGGELNSQHPYGSVVFSDAGLLTGITYGGGCGFGTIFQYNIKTSTFSRTYSICCSDDTQARHLYGSPTVIGNEIYGMSRWGGCGCHMYNCAGYGTLFKINTASSEYNSLFSFDRINGEFPIGSLCYINSKLYGLTPTGGAYNKGVIFMYDLLPINILQSKENLVQGGDEIYTIKITGDSIKYLWQVSTDTGTTWQSINNAGDKPKYFNWTSDSLLLQNVDIKNNGYMFRSIISRPCNPDDTSDIAILQILNVSEVLRQQDSLALVAIYNATDGAHWTNNTNWLGSEPITTWFGVTVAQNRVTVLDLHGNNLCGTIPPEIGNLENLNNLTLYNNRLSGAIPPEIGHLAMLTILELNVNQLSDNIPMEIWSLKSLNRLNLHNNNFSGSIPPEIRLLSNLKYLGLSYNSFSGEIPAEIGDLYNLTYLELWHNKLTGSIPKEIGNLSNLTYLSLSTNQLSGAIPKEICNLNNLTLLAIDNNQLSGEIPKEIGNLSKLIWLYACVNQLNGLIPSELGKLKNLKALLLDVNLLDGNIPTEIGNLENLTNLSLSKNQLSGTIPLQFWNLANLENLVLFMNQLNGTIPSEIGNLTKLTRLYLNNNMFSGNIPIEINDLHKLEVINLFENEFDGLPILTLNLLTELLIERNHLSFEDIEPNISLSNAFFRYSPQENIGIKKDTIVTVGSRFTINIYCGGEHNKYQWYKNNQIINGAIDKIYTIENVQQSDSGSFTCEITNTVVTGLTLNSNPIHLSVKGSTIVYNPQDISICSENDAFFTITTSGTNLSYLWQVNQGNGWNSLIDQGVYNGTSTNKLNLIFVPIGMNSYQYRCIISNSSEPIDTSIIATLKVDSLPDIFIQPTDISICENGTVNFVVSATGSSLTYQWQEDQGTGWMIINDGGMYSGSLTETLELSSIPLTNSGNRYRCLVDGACNQTDTSISVILSINTSTSSPCITEQPVDVVIETEKPFENTVFKVEAEGGDLEYHWEINDGSGWVIITEGKIYTGITSDSLVLNSYSIDMNGYQYRCIVKNKTSGIVMISSPAKLKVLSTVGIKVQNSNILKSFTIFPNPAQTEFTIRLNDPIKGRIVIKIFNSLGQMVSEYQAEKSNEEFNYLVPVNQYLSGLYYVQIIVNKGLYGYGKVMVNR